MRPAKLIVLSLLISTSMVLPVFAAQDLHSGESKLAEIQAQEARDAVTGPAFGVSAQDAAAETAAETAASETEADAPVPAGAAEADAAVAGEAPGAAPAPVTGEKGTYLGRFKTTGYYNSSGNASADGTMPRVRHTVSTDWFVIPPGTRIRFGDSDIVYTVEDTGVHGMMVDVYYETYSQAMSHGLQYKDVYLVE